MNIISNNQKGKVLEHLEKINEEKTDIQPEDKYILNVHINDELSSDDDSDFSVS